ncbi:methionine--tRNA ligase subunit beta [Nanoarchaeota archaeon]
MEGIVSFADWQKLNLRVGQIVEVEDMEGADQLYKMTIDIGSEKRTVCAGIKEFYSKEDLQDRKVIVFVNLTPRKLRGVESQGMILAAVTEGETKVQLLQPDGDIEIGSRVT